MNFQDLKQIDDYKVYLDIAFGKARRKAEELKQVKYKDKLKKRKELEIKRITSIGGELEKRLNIIIRNFPSLDNLPEFYNELVKATLDYVMLKKSLGALNWAIKQIKALTSQYNSKISKINITDLAIDTRKQYYGRISSVLKQIKNHLRFLEEARKIMRKYPAIKTSILSVSIVGFPNIGKTTLLTSLTSANAEINSYSFTTKGINIGYIYKENKRFIQVLDTPGTLNRIDKMNNIEKIAYLALKYVADLIIYVFDLTEPYSLGLQEKLFKRIIKDYSKPVVIFFSKTQLIDKEKLNEFRSRLKYKSFNKAEDLKNYLEEFAEENSLMEKLSS